jgi:hypothetical protein
MGLLGLAGVAVHPFGAVKAPRSRTPLLEGSETPAAIQRIVERSCQNCHSERTDWPWYSYLPPLSWLIEKDVHDAREHMNISRWQEYSTDQQVELLSKLGAEVRNHQMPIPRYLSLHPDARLSEAEVQELYQWSRGERRRLKAAGTAARKASSD